MIGKVWVGGGKGKKKKDVNAKQLILKTSKLRYKPTKNNSYCFFCKINRHRWLKNDNRCKINNHPLPIPPCTHSVRGCLTCFSPPIDIATRNLKYIYKHLQYFVSNKNLHKHSLLELYMSLKKGIECIRK